MSILPTEAEIAMLRSDVAAVITASGLTADVVRRTVVKDRTGGRTTTTATTTQDVAVFVIKPRAGRPETIAGGTERVAGDWELAFPEGTDIVVSDYLDLSDGRRFEVVDTSGPTPASTAMVVSAVQVAKPGSAT